MEGSLFIPRTENDVGWVIAGETRLIKEHFPFIKVTIVPGGMICIGKFRPTELSIEYTYKVEYRPNHAPKVYILSPCIGYNDETHMYPDKSLCLYYPGDYSWNDESHIYNTIIPWTHEWIVFYEWYQISGKWNHPAVQHRNNKANKLI
jgi:hypothetical protein